MRFYDIGESPLMGSSEKCIDPFVLGSLIVAGASLAGNTIGASSQNKTNQTSIDISRENNAFNAHQAQIQRDWQEKMWGMNNTYNSPNAMISRGLNPFVQGSAAMAGSKSPASGGAAASAAGLPSLQAFRPDFSDVGSALASMAQARAAMLNAESNAALTPYKMQQILGDTNFRNIGIGQSGYWNEITGRRSALLDQSKEYQELKNMEFAGRLTSAQEAQILLDSQAQQILNKYLDDQQQADLFIKSQTLANLYTQGALTEAQYKNQMAQAVKTAAETNGIRINNKIASQTADSLIYASIHTNRARGIFSSWDFDNVNAIKKGKLQQDEALRDYYRWSSKNKQKNVKSFELRNALDYGIRLFQGVSNSIGRK